MTAGPERNTALLSSAGSILGDLERCWQELRLMREAARRNGNIGAALSAIRASVELLRLKARVTGELDARPQVTVNIQQTQEWMRVRAVILTFVYERLGPRDADELSRRLRILDRS